MLVSVVDEKKTNQLRVENILPSVYFYKLISPIIEHNVINAIRRILNVLLGDNSDRDTVLGKGEY